MSSTISPGCAAARSNNTSATGASNASCACCRFNQRSPPGPFQYSISAALRSSPVGLIVRNSIRLTVCARSSRFEPATTAHTTPECSPRGSGTDRRMKFLPLIWSGIVAVSPEDGWPSAFTYTIAPESLAAFRKSRTAMLIRDTVTEKYGWKVGDHIPLMMSMTPQKNGSTNWAFDVVGTFTDSDVG